jgi:hypothetical protein
MVARISVPAVGRLNADVAAEFGGAFSHGADADAGAVCDRQADPVVADFQAQSAVGLTRTVARLRRRAARCSSGLPAIR